MSREYKTEKLLGKGAFGDVHLATLDGKKVAIKTIKYGEELEERLFAKNEILMFGNLSSKKTSGCHDSVACLYEAWDNPKEKVMTMVMEYVDGDTLDEFSGKLKPEEIKILFNDAVVKLVYIHKEGVMHRDIKPANMIYVNFRGIVYVDLGFSCVYDIQKNRKKQSDIVECWGTPGTREYIDPEILLGNIPYNDSRSDVYSLGCVFYFLIVGEHPRIIQEPSQINDNYEYYKKQLDSNPEYKPITEYVKQMMNPIINERPTIDDVYAFLGKDRIFFNSNPGKKKFEVVNEKFNYTLDFFKKSIDDLLKNRTFTDATEFAHEYGRHVIEIETSLNQKVPNDIYQQIAIYIYNLFNNKEVI